MSVVDEATSGEASRLRIALWGTERDERAIKRLRGFLPGTLGQLCREYEEEGWHLHQNSQLRLRYDYFVIKPHQIGLSVPEKDGNYLRALAVFLSSSVASYYLFFHTPPLDIECDSITLEVVKSIPIPDFTSGQVEELAHTQQQLEQMENEWGIEHTQGFLDEEIARVLRIPDKILLLAVEFHRIRTKLIGGGAYRITANENNLQAYAQELVNELDGFISPSETRHKVTISYTRELIRCTVELIKTDRAIPVMVEEAEAETDLFGQIRHTLQDNFSQLVSSQKGLRFFEGRKMYLYKISSLLHWTRTQALNDADDLIAEVLMR